MCVGNLLGGNQQPATPTRQSPAPTMKAAAPPPEYVAPEDLRKDDDEDKISTKKKKQLEIEKQKKGVKQFGAVNPDNLPNTPEGGVNPPR